MKAVVFTGMMGSGKTSAGRLLAEKLGLQFVDIDEQIEKREGCSISEIFQQKGEIYFRKKESDVIRKSLFDNVVISLGGGAFEDENTREFLLSNAVVIYLKTSAEVILKRIQNTNVRPLLKNNMNVNKINAILKNRENSI